MELGQIETAKIATTEIKPVAITKTEVKYPTYEDMVFRANIESEAEGIELLTCIQAVVNFAGAKMIIQAVRAIEKDPSIIQKAMSALPLLKYIP